MASRGLAGEVLEGVGAGAGLCYLTASPRAIAGYPKSGITVY
jgi:hypothetical protein